MTTLREAAQQALERLIVHHRTWDARDDLNVITALKAALEQPVQAEPVAWRTFDGEGGYDYRTYDDNENYRYAWDRRNPNHKEWVEPLFTHPPRREWRSLSEEEIQSIHDTYHKRMGPQEFARDIEAKLKEKNQ